MLLTDDRGGRGNDINVHYNGGAHNAREMEEGVSLELTERQRSGEDTQCYR